MKKVINYFSSAAIAICVFMLALAVAGCSTVNKEDRTGSSSSKAGDATVSSVSFTVGQDVEMELDDEADNSPTTTSKNNGTTTNNSANTNSSPKPVSSNNSNTAVSSNNPNTETSSSNSNIAPSSSSVNEGWTSDYYF